MTESTGSASNMTPRALVAVEQPCRPEFVQLFVLFADLVVSTPEAALTDRAMTACLPVQASSMPIASATLLQPRSSWLSSRRRYVVVTANDE